LSVLTYTYLYSFRIFIFLFRSSLLLFYHPILSSSSFSSSHSSSVLFFLYNPLPIPSQSISRSLPLLFLLSQYSFYTCRYLHILIYILFRSFQMFWPRTFYRSGWLRCDVFKYVFMFWAGGWLLKVWAFDIRCYYYILYYTYTLLYITIIIYYILYILYTIIIYYTYTILLYTIFFLFFHTPLLFLINPPSSLLYSFYTCRYLDTHIYIHLSISSPHPLLFSSFSLPSIHL
jgi:hypothetical protein